LQQCRAYLDVCLATRESSTVAGTLLNNTPTVSTHDSVLVGGESVTRHSRSARSSGRFVALNCAGVAETLLESELLGHVVTITTVGFRAAT